MKIDDIRALAKIMKENDLTSLKIDEDGVIIELGRESAKRAAFVPAEAPKTSVSSEALASSPAAEAPAAPSDDDDVMTVTAPMVGMFYAAPNPKDKPYVTVGAKVKTGDILCIIEAMKLMNEIVSEVDGTVENIYVGNEHVVEFGQPLFRIRRD
ncbi:MAG: acetyl-CoA carboxylase biotin carboxyl carrier protein [Synergistes sp.]|nr:acetyl-CoA carboxylase biotin carboxyl carrier protein [Clostridia bacterium]MBQ9882534.1 acetyl-CoA carboxylase biotin carboxyl carrier protein [Synergistes sp.]